MGEINQVQTQVTRYLDEQNVPYEIKSHSKPVFTSEEAAVERGVRLSQVVKTMLLTDGEEILIAVLPSDRRLDTKKIKKLTGHKTLQFMNKESIEEKTGLTVGAVAPVGCGFEGLPMFVDPTVFEEEFLDISSGNPSAGLELHRNALKELLKEAIFVEITKEENR